MAKRILVRHLVGFLEVEAPQGINENFRTLKWRHCTIESQMLMMFENITPFHCPYIGLYLFLSLSLYLYIHIW